jgi:hypothetical protein
LRSTLIVILQTKAIGRTLAPDAGEINTFDLDDIDDHAMQSSWDFHLNCCEIDDPPCAPAKGPDRVNRADFVMSALRPLMLQERRQSGH